MNIKMFFVIAFSFIVLMIAGCNTSTPPPTNSDLISDSKGKIMPSPDHYLYDKVIELSTATVYLTDFYNESPDRKVANITYRTGYGNFERQFVLEKSASTDGFTNYSALLLDTEGTLMWEITAMIDSLDLYRMGIREKTSRDQLDIMISYRDGLITEDYNLNGDRFYVEYTESDIDDYLQLSNSSSSQAKLRPNEDNSNLSEKYEEFVQFYPEDMSLNNNTDGFVTMELLQSDEFTDWMMVDPDSPEFGLDIESLCEWATNVAMIKCFWGGIGNPVCHAAFGISVACAIYKQLSKLF